MSQKSGGVGLRSDLAVVETDPSMSYNADYYANQTCGGVARYGFSASSSSIACPHVAAKSNTNYHKNKKGPNQKTTSGAAYLHAAIGERGRQAAAARSSSSNNISSAAQQQQAAASKGLVCLTDGLSTSFKFIGSNHSNSNSQQEADVDTVTTTLSPQVIHDQTQTQQRRSNEPPQHVHRMSSSTEYFYHDEKYVQQQ